MSNTIYVNYNKNWSADSEWQIMTPSLFAKNNLFPHKKLCDNICTKNFRRYKRPESATFTLPAFYRAQIYSFIRITLRIKKSAFRNEKRIFYCFEYSACMRQQTPCTSIALATFSNPAMFAPAI